MSFFSAKCYTAVYMFNTTKKRAPRAPQKPQQLDGVATFPMRINKYLAVKKYSTRRGADKLIETKQVYINKRLAKLGDQVEENDVVEVRLKGKQIPLVYYAYNKPRGLLTYSAEEEDSDIQRSIPIKGVFPVGRLDKDSSGLIILTNDGRITERLLHPRFEHEKEYLVTTKEPLRNNFKTKMEAGVRIEREKTKPCSVTIVDSQTFRVILTEGKKHQIRRMCVALFQEVRDLKRIRVLNIELRNLQQGQHRQIEGVELQAFLKLLDLA